MTATHAHTPEAAPSPGQPDLHRVLSKFGKAELEKLPLPLLEAMERRLAWYESARPDQLPPDRMDTSWFAWLQLGGRGSGKTRTGAEWIWDEAFSNPGSRWAIVAPTNADVLKTCFEGESGLLACIPQGLVANWSRQEKVLTLMNGSMIFGYSAEEPDRLRGPQHHGAWCDELAAWRYLDDALDNLLMGLRLGKTPRVIMTTTPRPIKRLKEIIAASTTRVDRVSTYANKANLPSHFFNVILRRYEGTRLGRQELMAEVIEDVPGALWSRSMLDTTRVAPDPQTGMVMLPDMSEIVVAVDPSTTSTADSDECGIVACGRGTDRRGYVLRDESLTGTPAAWARRAVLLYDELQAGWIVYEGNQGGDMVADVLRSAAKGLKDEGLRDTDFVPLKAVWASRGKVTRAEPVSALYEQGAISHVGAFAKLEDQMCEFTSDFDRKKAGYSPDRVDALVWGFNQVMLGGQAANGLMEYYRQENDRLQAAAKGEADPHPPAELRPRPILMTQGGQAAQKEEPSVAPWFKSQDHHAGAKPNGSAPFGWSMSQRPTAKVVHLVPPDGCNTAFGKTGKRYMTNTEGYMEVDEEDSPPLLGAGFKVRSN